MIVLKLTFNLIAIQLFISHKKRNFIDYSGYFIPEVAAILDFARLCKSNGRFTLAQRMDFLLCSSGALVERICDIHQLWCFCPPGKYNFTKESDYKKIHTL